jgi:ABC-2 type transport system permease protein
LPLRDGEPQLIDRDEWRAIGLVCRREYSQRVRSLSFLASTFLTPLFFALVLAAPALFAASNLIERKRIVVVCAEPRLANDIQASFRRWPRFDATTIITTTPQERRKLTAMVRAGRIHAFIWIDNAAIASGRVAYVSRDQPDFFEKDDLRSTIDWAITRERLERRGLNPAEVDAALAPVELKPTPIGDAAARADGGKTAALVVTVMLITMLEASLLSYGIVVMRSVLEDKTSRITELLLCAAPARALMAGKVIGIGAVSFTQAAIWAAMAAAGVSAGTRLIGTSLGGAIHLSAPHIAFCVIFYLLGYILYSSLYAALGAAFNSLDEAQYWNFVLTLPLLFSGIAAWSLIEFPNSATAVALSIFPPSAPVMMSMRIAAGVAPIWQVGFALALLGGTIWIALAISSRIYNVGILMYGKKPTLREIVRWLRYA